MGCCQRCCTGTCFAICILLTIGLTLGVLIYSTVVTYKLKDVNSTLFIILCVVTCFTGLIFIFGVYASCCGKKCAKGGLAAIYLVYALVLGAVGVLMLLYKAKLVDFVREAYNKGDYKADTIKEIEDAFKCKFPPKSNSKSLKEDAEIDDCFDKLDKYIDLYGLIFGIILIVLFVILFIAAVFACRFACKKTEASSGSKSREPVETPLTYGW